MLILGFKPKKKLKSSKPKVDKHLDNFLGPDRYSQMNKSYHAIVNKSSDVTSSQIMTDKNVSSEIIIKANIPEQEKILPYEDINLEEHKDMGEILCNF